MTAQVKFAELMAAAAAVYNQRPMSKQGLEMYWRLMARFEIDQISVAMQQHMENSEFFPKPANLIAIIDGEVSDQALAAWTSALTAVKRVGHTSKPMFHDALIRPTIAALGGWATFCRMQEREMQFWQKRFSDAYISLKRRDKYATAIDSPKLKVITDAHA